MRIKPCFFLIIVMAFACCTTRPAPVDGASTATPDPPDERKRDGGETRRAVEPALTAVVNEEYQPVLLDMLDRAAETILVVHFECNKDSTIDQFVDRLIAAADRGVKVQVLLEADVEDNAARVEELEDAGVAAKLDSGERYTHAKLVIVDGVEVLFGSTNFSFMSVKYNNETNLHIVSVEVGSYFTDYANALWFDPVATPVLSPVSVPSIQLVSTLHDGDYFHTAHTLIENAKERVHLLVYAIHMNNRYPDGDVHKLVAALIAAHKRGVEVKVILEVSDYNETLNGMNQATADFLGKNCVQVRFEPLDQISHAKLLLVDDTAVVGSNNWGHGGLHLYHEVGGVTTNEDAVNKFTEYFFSIWKESSRAARGCGR